MSFCDVPDEEAGLATVFFGIGKMNTTRAFLLIAACLAIGSVCVSASYPLTGPAKKIKIERYLTGISGSDSAAIFGVMKDDGTINTYTGGPISSDNTLRFGSVSKMFTSHEWFKTQSDIGSALETHPSQNGFTAAYTSSDTITYRQIMSMTSGIPEYTLDIGWNDTSNEFIPPTFSVQSNIDLAWKNQPLDYTPGSYFHYSNTNCEVVGETVTRQSGDVYQRLKQRWQYIAPSIQYDPGTIPDSAWPNTTGYLPWYYPPTLPGVSGSLIGTLPDLLKAFDIIADDPSVYFRRQWTDTPSISLPGYVPAGKKYGLFWQKYDLSGPAEGHEGDYVVRTIVVRHRPTRMNFAFHYAQHIDNPTLMTYFRELIRMYL